MTRLTREQVIERLAVDPKTLTTYLNRTKRAQGMGRDITTRPYRNLPLPDDDDLWDEQVIEDYIADAPARAEHRRSRTRGPANRVIVVDGESRMVVLVEHQITREELRVVLANAWGDHALSLPMNRAELLPLVRACLQNTGLRQRVDTRNPDVDKALNILWPEEA